MNEVKIFNEVNELMNALAESIVIAAEYAIEVNGKFNFVLSGGSSPKKLYELLASDSFKNKIDWDKTFFFFGDERFLPEDNSERNSMMVKEALFEPLHIKSDNIFKVNPSGSPEESAKNYWDSILKHFNGKPVEFDFNLLGLGDNSHTASLFPNTSVLNEMEATVKSVFVEEVDMYRITMTAPLINQSKNIVFLVFGEGKAEAVFHILEYQAGSENEFPARLIKSEGKVVWFLDSAAAGRL
ncbi:6-phosphogluconolactonase [Halpernia frigidisoli]|uniref:6-phosphogluconolactonase n=1 Tax=Halpernia frigidisoli TaxID=1125876 RepID=A0A1I3FVS0_9FLAO|nr:6-phosphogluconolactonase [Halpernia frigidisoli]SFI15031.1 6-phosphogluconolactonase [Halpernia frigidisoli]